jgi:hypothetical protein
MRLISWTHPRGSEQVFHPSLYYSTQAGASIPSLPPLLNLGWGKYPVIPSATQPRLGQVSHPSLHYSTQARASIPSLPPLLNLGWGKYTVIPSSTQPRLLSSIPSYPPLINLGWGKYSILPTTTQPRLGQVFNPSLHYST